MENFDGTQNSLFPYLCINVGVGEVRYLGYRLELTPCEYEVLRALYGAGNGLTKKDIVLLSDAGAMLTEKSVAVHICSLNKKSVALGGRKLIESKRKSGYFINKNS